MLLGIDVGNTDTVFALYDGDDLSKSWRLRTQIGRSVDEYAGFLSQMFDLCGFTFDIIEDVIISSVVPDTDFHLRGLCQAYLGCEAVFISKDNVPIKLDVDRPEQVGADRLVNAVAVNIHYCAPAIVVDFGTATTFDVISADGAYAGGVIAPGVHLSVEALHAAASKLPKVSVRKPEKIVGRSTKQAMYAGIYYGYESLIEGVVHKIKHEQGFEDMLVLATGGLATLFAQGSDVIDQVDQDLTLKGLYDIHKGLRS